MGLRGFDAGGGRSLREAAEADGGAAGVQAMSLLRFGGESRVPRERGRRSEGRGGARQSARWRGPGDVDGGLEAGAEARFG